jgi:tetratricopeptide (TPR) repeat protein
MLDKCKRVRIQVLASIITSTIEAFHCEDVEFELSVPVGTMQVDECPKAVIAMFAERDHVGRIYHQNSPGLSVGWAGREAEAIGKASEVQLCTRPNLEGSKESLLTAPVRRGEGDFPIDLPGDDRGAPRDEPDAEAAPAAEERRRQADVKREKGNEMFRANDFLQAAMEYTSALELDPTMGALYANRAQCWLKLGNHEKALEDAEKCTEVDPGNAKGWFRKGMCYQAMKRYPEAIPPLLEAEKIEPTNKQVVEAIKMAQLMARRSAERS